MSIAAADSWVVLGRVAGLWGVRGGLKVWSDTQPRAAICRYRPLFLGRDGQWREVVPVLGREQGKGIVMQFDGVEDRDAAAALIGCEIAIRREQLPAPAPGEYYWTDLVGLRVETLDGIELGHVDHLFETGSNDVIVVRGERERLIPFLRGSVIQDIDLEAGRMRVDWDPDF